MDITGSDGLCKGLTDLFNRLSYEHFFGTQIGWGVPQKIPPRPVGVGVVPELV